MATKNIKQYKDIDLSFKVNPFTKDIYLKTDEEAVKTAIKHLIRTKNFERCFHPEIGTQVHNLLFEPLSAPVKIALEQTITESITRFEPRVRLIEVTVSETTDVNELLVNVIFSLINSNIPITLSTILTRVR